MRHCPVTRVSNPCRRRSVEKTCKFHSYLLVTSSAGVENPCHKNESCSTFAHTSTGQKQRTLKTVTIMYGLSLMLRLLFLLSMAASTVNAQTVSLPAETVPWPATDALGRALPMPGEVTPPRRDRFVGIFYFLWHNQHEATAT